jgi:thymidylate kinase
VSGSPVAVGIEGPCCGGKTTLGRGLIRDFAGHRVAYVKDYSDHVGGGRFLPPAVPNSVTDEEVALRRFLAIEHERAATARASGSQLDLVLIDRSVHTLLAHCVALTRATGLDHSTAAKRIIHGSADPLWPDVILCLDVTHEAVRARNRGKFPPNSIFVDKSFNRSIQSYFAELAGVSHPRVVWLDATIDATILLRQAAAEVAASLPR